MRSLPDEGRGILGPAGQGPIDRTVTVKMVIVTMASVGTVIAMRVSVANAQNAAVDRVTAQIDPLKVAGNAEANAKVIEARMRIEQARVASHQATRPVGIRHVRARDGALIVMGRQSQALGSADVVFRDPGLHERDLGCPAAAE